MTFIMFKKSLSLTLFLALLMPWAANAQKAESGSTEMKSCEPIVITSTWSEDFESFPVSTSGVTLSDPCWENVRTAGTGTKLFEVYSSPYMLNTTNQLRFPATISGTMVKLRLPEMYLPNANYQFVLDIYRNTNHYGYENEGIRVFASTNGEIAGATPLAFISRNFTKSTSYGNVIPAEAAAGWYTYELPLNMSGTCYIILRGETVNGSAIYLDNFSVEPVPTCAKPIGLACTALTAHTATLNWTDGETGQDAWEIAYSTQAGFDPSTVTPVTVTTHPATLADLDAGWQYHVCVRANCGGDDVSAWSSPISFTTAISDCPAPDDLTPSNVTNHSATLTWTPGNELQAAWQLKYQKGSDFNPATEGTLVDGITIPTYTFDKTLDAASQYYIYIRGNCGDDYDIWSSVCTLTTVEAAPAPTAFNTVSVGPDCVDLSWDAPAGDYLSGYGIYYSTSSTAPSTTTPATVTINSAAAPTAAAPYRLTGLSLNTTYYLWLRANHQENVYSTWVALTGASIQTTGDCPTPTQLTALPMHNTAHLSWTGYSESYTVEYRTALTSGTVLLSEHFDGSGFPTGWEAMGSGTDHWQFRSSNYAGGTPREAVLYWDPPFDGTARLVSPAVDLTGKSGVVVNFKHYLDQYSGSHILGIATSSDNGATWHSGWSNTYSADGSGLISEVITTDDMGNANVRFCIYYTGNSGGIQGWHFDDFEICEIQQASTWVVADDNVIGETYDLTGLTAAVSYDVRVKGNCAGGAYSTLCTLTTIDDNTKIFHTAGNWDEAGHWEGGIPGQDNDVIVRANATIPADCDALANTIAFENAATLTIKDGGQLHCNTAVTATIEKDIAGYTSTHDNYYLLGAPGEQYHVDPGVASSPLTGLLTGSYDLYRFDGTQAGAEWRNYKTDPFKLWYGKGYLYANGNDITLRYTGPVSARLTEGHYNYLNYGTPDYLYNALSYNTSKPFGTFNLLGNPLPHNGYVYVGYRDLYTEEYHIVSQPYYYQMNDTRDELVVSNRIVKPWEGVFVKPPYGGLTAIITSEALLANPNSSALNISLLQGQSVYDAAVINFGKGEDLEKFQLNPNHTKIYIPVEGKGYAVARAEGQVGEMPLCFKAEKDGIYTVSFSDDNVGFSYLHLVDNMTGNNVDLLALLQTQGSATYTFNAKTTDYACRFRLLFATGASTGSGASETFGFINSLGNFCIFGIEGEATVQVVDVLGHVISSDTFSGSYEQKLNVAPGIYMVRLINGNDVKVQKLIVR